MTIGRTKNGIITIIPDEGMGVTNGEVIADSIVFLGVHDKVENWRDCELPEPESEVIV